MRDIKADVYFTTTVLECVNAAILTVQDVVRYAESKTGSDLPKLAVSTMFHTAILTELKKQKAFANARDVISDFSYKGERWELKTSRTKNSIGVNKVNILEKVMLLLVNAEPEKGMLFQVRVLDSRDRYFGRAPAGTQIRTLNDEGKEKAVNLYLRKKS